MTSHSPHPSDRETVQLTPHTSWRYDLRQQLLGDNLPEITRMILTCLEVAAAASLLTLLICAMVGVRTGISINAQPKGLLGYAVFLAPAGVFLGSAIAWLAVTSDFRWTTIAGTAGFFLTGGGVYAYWQWVLTQAAGLNYTTALSPGQSDIVLSLACVLVTVALILQLVAFAALLAAGAATIFVRGFNPHSTRVELEYGPRWSGHRQGRSGGQ